MKPDEALDLLKQDESQSLEFKESFPGREKASVILCGFANTNGGTLVIGAKRGKIVGIEGSADELQRKISLAAQCIKSPPLVSQEICNLSGKSVLFVKVHRATDVNFHTFNGVIYVRVGSTTQRLEAQTMLEYLRNRQILCFDEGASDAGIDEIDAEKVSRFLGTRNQENYLKEHSLKEFLASLRLTTSGGDFSIKNAALLFFAKTPTHLLPQAEIKVAKFSGHEAIDIVSHRLIQGDVVEQIESSIGFIKQNVSRQLTLDPESPKRGEIFEYPLFTIREAIVNAVVHRDYFSKDAIQVNIFSDRMEITSPGTIPSDLSPANFGRLSVQRNPITYRLLRDCHYVEGLGTGIPRMRNEMRKAGLKDPIFDFTGNFFRVVLINMKGSLKPIEGIKDLNQRQIKAIEYLRQNKTIKSGTYASINSVSIPTAINDLRELMRFKFVKKVGSYRGAYYVLDEGKFK